MRRAVARLIRRGVVGVCGPLLRAARVVVPGRGYFAVSVDRGVRQYLKVLNSDNDRYLASCIRGDLPDDPYQLRARLTMYSHALEKGLSYREMRLGFGQDRFVATAEHLHKYREVGASEADPHFLAAVRVLFEYLEVHAREGFDVAHLAPLAEPFEPLLARADAAGIPHGTLELTRDEMLAGGGGPFAELSRTRCSTRDFAPERVDPKIIHEAVRLAQKSPSACNRQASSVVVIQTPELVQRALALQTGNRGFGHQVRTVLIVKTDLRAFYGETERQQGFVDGGMFAMSLIYGLHSQGVGTCSLNWSNSLENDAALRDLIGLRASEAVLMFIAAGYYAETFRATASVRLPTEEVYRLL